MTDTAAPSPPVALPSRRRVAAGALVGVAVASIAAVFFVLPAEFGIDPTGFGEATGLTGLAGGGGEENIYLKRGQARTNTLFALDAGATPDEATLRKTLAEKGVALPAGRIRSDRFAVELLPYEGIELKYDHAQGAPMVFRWKASKPVYLDMHSHPFVGGTDLTESFVIDDLPGQAGVYVAPFNGIHGWYWQNRTLETVPLELDTTGQVTGSRLFDAGGEHPRPLPDEAAAESQQAATPTP
jgi:hypothetical protein